jgi:molecular chaperone GrpE
MENLRKRFERERVDTAKYAASNFARDMLEIADNFRRALHAIPDDLKTDDRAKPLIEGIEATERALLKIFERQGIKKLEPHDGPFDPNFHEVMFEAPVPGKTAGTIIQLVEAGYMLHDRLLRPARVGVAKGEAGAHSLDTEA